MHVFIWLETTTEVETTTEDVPKTETPLATDIDVRGNEEAETAVEGNILRFDMLIFYQSKSRRGRYIYHNNFVIFQKRAA